MPAPTPARPYPSFPPLPRGRPAVAAAWTAALLLGLVAAGTSLAAEEPADAAEETGAEAASPPQPGPGFDPERGELRSTPTQGIEEITITGEILESSTQNEPEAITTFDQEELDTLGIANVDTLALNTPSLHVGQVGQQAIITLRGIGLENLTSVGETGVGFEIDGIHLGRPAAANSAFFDLERLDVLRGPQGQNGGRNVTAGRIALSSKKPEEDFNASGDVTIGNYALYETRGILNVPIYKDKLMSRASIFWQRRQGYQSWRFAGVPANFVATPGRWVNGGRDSMNPDDAKNLATRLQLRSLLLDQQLELRAIGVWNIQKGNGPAVNLIGPPPDSMGSVLSTLQNCIDPDTGEILPPENRNLGTCPPGNFVPMRNSYIVPDFNRDGFRDGQDANGDGIVDENDPRDCPGPAFRPVARVGATDGFPSEACVTADPRTTYADTPSAQDNKQQGLTGHIHYDLPYFADTPLSDLHVGVVAGWWRIVTQGTFDFDGTNIPDSYFFLRRSSKQTSTEIYLERPDVGLFDFKVGFFWYREDIDSALCFDSIGPSSLGDLAFDGDIRTRHMSGYASVGFRPFDNVRISGGLRYIEEKKKANQINENYRVRDLTNRPGLAIKNDPREPGQGSAPSYRGLTQTSKAGCGLGISNLFFSYLDPAEARAGLFIDQVRPVGGSQKFCNGFPSNISCSPSANKIYKPSWNGLTPKMALEWQMTDSSTVQLSATNGFKAGGFPLAFDAALANSIQGDYPAEEVWQYEANLKNEFLDGLLRLNLTGFWTEYDPFQICQFAGPTFFCRGDGSATIRGIEIEWLANPVQGLQINGFFNYLHSRVNNFQLLDPTVRDCKFWGAVQIDPDGSGPRPRIPKADFCREGQTNPQPGLQYPRALPPRDPVLATVDVSGNQLPKAPTWQGSLGVQYTVDLGRWGYVTPRAQTQFQGQTFYRVFNREEFSQTPYYKVDLKLSWRSENERFSAEAFVYNLTDVDVINSMFVGPQATGGQVLGQYQSPRRYGVKFSVNYVSDLIDGWF